MIYAFLTQHFVVRIYALFPQIILDWKAKSADIFTFLMHALGMSDPVMEPRKCSRNPWKTEIVEEKLRKLRKNGESWGKTEKVEERNWENWRKNKKVEDKLITLRKLRKLKKNLLMEKWESWGKKWESWEKNWVDWAGSRWIVVVIFKILEPSAFQKYCTCWVFSSLLSLSNVMPCPYLSILGSAWPIAQCAHCKVGYLRI